MNTLKLFMFYVYVLFAYLICVHVPVSPKLPKNLNEAACFALELQS